MITKEHEDGDSVELGDPRHLETVRMHCDVFDNRLRRVRQEFCEEQSQPTPGLFSRV